MIQENQEATHEALEGHAASDDLMQIWREREERALSQLSDGLKPEEGAQAIHEDVRGRVLWFMAHLVKIAGLPEKSWFDAVVLLDTYCARADSPIPVGDLPALCVALVKLLKKMDSQALLSNDSQLWGCAMQMAHHLRQVGHDIEHPAVTREKCEMQEVAVLKALRWQIALPNVNTWMLAYCARMNTFSKQELLPALAWIWQQSRCLARTLLLHRAISQSYSSRHLVQGMLGVGFVAAGMLSPDSLGLKDMQDLESIFSQQHNEAVPSPKPVWSQQHQQLLLEVYQAATCSTLDDLENDCKLVQAEMSRICQHAKVRHSSI